MASTSETGHTKNVDNFETMISFCTGYGATYNPSNSNLTVPNLTTLFDDSKAAVKLVKTTESSFNDIEGHRKLLFKPLKTLATKVLGALRSSGAPATVIADAETINRKIQGKRADNTIVTPQPGETAKTKISVSQQSFDMLIDHFEKLIELVSIESSYNPNEEPLKVSKLIEYKKDLEIVNTKVKNAYSPYSNAMIARDKKLYNPETGLVTIAQLVKNYVKSVYNASGPEYKQINKLRFKTIIK